MSAMIGKRVIVLWTTDAFNAGNEWIAYRVIDESPDGFWVYGVDSPDGAKHDGSKTFISYDEFWDIVEWKETAPDLLDALTVIATIATPPHHPNALNAIAGMARAAVAKATGKEDA